MSPEIAKMQGKSGPAPQQRPGPDTEGATSMQPHRTAVPVRNQDGQIIAWGVIDQADAHLLRHRWSFNTRDREKRYLKNWEGQLLHRAVLGLGPEDPRRVDHINGNPLDNRRVNLRIVTTAQNAQNQGSRGGSSRHRGVTWDRSRQKWMASAMLDGRRRTIGRFDSEDEAGAAASAWRAEHMPFSAEAAP